jgi:hypothetical protein
VIIIMTEDADADSIYIDDRIYRKNWRIAFKKRDV